MEQAGPVEYSALTGPKLQAWLLASALRESGRTLALENVVQWLFFRLLRLSDRPADLKAELVSHVQAQIKMTRTYGIQHTVIGEVQEAAEAASAAQALHELLESLDASVVVDS